ncbi:MAG: zinc-ribbon domain-containing protein, partial [Myxococcales bacterium]|nr:zinc-ribbon domain-containing protein [Myxococcales bacterium]
MRERCALKFTCDHCSTRYTLSDEKVRNKVLKIRCKVCENIMVVRDPNAGQPAPKPLAARPAPPQPEEDRTQLSNPLGAGFDAEWYAAAAGMQHGPMPIERLIDEIRQGQVKADDLVWNATMDDWRPAREVPELQGVVRARAAARAARARPAPPPPSASDDEATVIQGSPDLFRLETSRGPEELLTREVSAAVDALHPVDTSAEVHDAAISDDVDTTLWTALGGDPDETAMAPPPSTERPVVAPAPKAPAPPAPKAPTPKASAPKAPAPPVREPSVPVVPSAPPAPLQEPSAPPVPVEPPSAAPAIPTVSEAPPAAEAPDVAAKGDWMASLADHLEDAPVAQRKGEIAAITQAAPPKHTPWGRVALVLLLLG